MPARRQSQADAPSSARRRTAGRKGGSPAPKANGRKHNGQKAAGGPADEASTPTKVVEAAIACILEEGFYRASSNEIARRADVTWGVIQYHFGTREALMLAVLQHAAAELQQTLATSRITGDTLDERLESLADIVWSYYARPEFLAYMQVMLNLSHDPDTEGQTREAIRENQIHVSHQLPQLLRHALVPDVPADHPQLGGLCNFVFAALRGMAIDQGHLEALPRDEPVDAAAHAAQRRMLVAALALHVRGEVASSRSLGRRAARAAARVAGT